MSAETPSTPEIVGPILREHVAQIEQQLRRAPPTPTPEQEREKAVLRKRHQDFLTIIGLLDADPVLMQLVDTDVQAKMDKEKRQARSLTIWVSTLTALLGAFVAWLLTAFPLNSVVPQLFGR
jgi:hypothetical protein